MVEPDFSIAIRIFTPEHEKLIMGILLKKMDEKDPKSNHISWSAQGDYPYDAVIWWSGEEGFRSEDMPATVRCHKVVDTEWVLRGGFDREWDKAVEKAQKLNNLTWRDIFDGHKVPQSRGEACRKAEECGYGYLLWNGRVFEPTKIGDIWEGTNLTEEDLKTK